MPRPTPANPARGTGSTASGGLSVTRYELASSGLVSALILIGGLVCLLFLLWLTTRVWVKATAIEPQLIEPLAGGGEAMADASELVEPGEEDWEEAPPELQESLASITDLISTQVASYDALDTNQERTSKGQRATGPKGPGTDSTSIIPRWERWELQFSNVTVATYARQLDALGIELAAVGGGQEEIDYAFHLSQPRPDRRTGKQDSRIYFAWSRDNSLRTADLELLRRAGIPTDNRTILKFIPPAIENQCALLEDAAIKKRGWTLEQVRRTLFVVVPLNDSFQFQVANVQSR